MSINNVLGNMVINLQFFFRDNGNEVITRFTIAGLENNGVFYTDSNGRETLKRTRNVHPGYKYNYTQEPVSSNYYPVTAALAIKDKDVGVAILNDRSQGGSSVRDGEIELMVSSLHLLKLFSLTGTWLLFSAA